MPSLNPRMTVRATSSPSRWSSTASAKRRRRRATRSASCSSWSACPRDAADRYPHEFSRRPAPAHRHRPGARPAARSSSSPTSRSRRSTSRSRRRSSTCSRTCSSELGLTLPVHRPRPVGRAPHLRPRRGHVPRQARRARRTDDELYDRPRHPYTEALLSAVPIPDPPGSGQRQRIVLTARSPTRMTRRPGAASRPAARSSRRSAATSPHRSSRRRPATGPPASSDDRNVEFPRHTVDRAGAATGRPLPVAVVGLLAGFLAGLFGVGGGILIVPGLVLDRPHAQRLAHGTSLAAVLPISVASLITYAAHGNVDWTSPRGWRSVPSAAPSSARTCSTSFPSARSAIIFIVVLVASALRLFLDRTPTGAVRLTPARRTRPRRDRGGHRGARRPARRRRRDHHGAGDDPRCSASTRSSPRARRRR